MKHKDTQLPANALCHDCGKRVGGRRVIVMVECSERDGPVGTTWTEAKSFDPNETLHHALHWAALLPCVSGRVTITKDAP